MEPEEVVNTGRSSVPALEMEATVAAEVKSLDLFLPPARSPTTWKVQRTTLDEKAAFREQERQRFSDPYRAFTYRLHGYESVVGPVKWAAKVKNPVRDASIVLAGEYAIFIDTLVSDAVARLPNGEGTLQDISILLEDSQYFPRVHDMFLFGALARLQGDVDPCLWYDAGRKMWLYLHRAKAEYELEYPCGENRTYCTRRRMKAALQAPSGDCGQSALSPPPPPLPLPPPPLIPSSLPLVPVTTTSTIATAPNVFVANCRPQVSPPIMVVQPHSSDLSGSIPTGMLWPVTLSKAKTELLKYIKPSDLLQQAPLAVDLTGTASSSTDTMQPRMPPSRRSRKQSLHSILDS